MKHERALLIEDDGSWQEILTELLEDGGFQVDRAHELGEAETLIRSQTHRLAVVDLSLGGPDHRNQDGLRILDLIARCDPGCQAILLTGFATVELAVDVITEGKAVTCLRKENFSRAAFRQLLNKASQAPPSVPKPPAKTASSERSGQRGCALIVEDDAGWRSLLEELVADCGLRALSCGSFAEARGHLQRENLCLTVVDLTLASSLDSENQDGLALLSVVKEAGLPAIVVSGTSSAAVIDQAFREEDVFGFFEKQDFDRKAFRRLVEQSVVPSELEVLTDREREVLDLLAEGLTNQQIADRLFISTNTVKRHLKTVFEKLGVNNRAAAAALVTREAR